MTHIVKNFLLLIFFLLSCNAHALPGRKEFIVNESGHVLHFIAYDHERMVVVKKIKAYSISSGEILCGNYPMIKDKSVFEEKIVSFQDPEAGRWGNEKFRYTDNKTNLTLYSKACFGK